MYKFQIVDADSQEILMDEDHKDLDFISELFRTSTNPDVMDCLITDSQNRRRMCTYDSHSIHQEGKKTIYKILFKTKLAKEHV